MKQIYILTILSILGLNTLYSQNNNFLNFDGTNDYVSTTLPSVFLDIPNNDFTIETWVFPETFVFSRILFAQLNATNFISISLLSTGKITCYVSNVSGEQTTSSISLNLWSHVAMTWNHTTQEIQIYINGVLATLDAGAFISSIGDDNIMTIGARTNQAQFYNGSIDELRIWSTIRTQSEISSNMNVELSLPQTNLVNYYEFNQGIGGADNTGITTLNDELNANDGTLNNFTLNGLSSNWLNSSILSVNDITNITSSVKLFPNPSSETIQISGLKTKEPYKIYNNLGVKILSGTISNQEKIDIRNFTNGLYFLKFENGNTIKFIKE